MSEKKELVEKARRLGREYLRKYGGCAPGTLMAVADTLDLRVGDELFKAMTGFGVIEKAQSVRVKWRAQFYNVNEVKKSA